MFMAPTGLLGSVDSTSLNMLAVSSKEHPLIFAQSDLAQIS